MLVAVNVTLLCVSLTPCSNDLRFRANWFLPTHQPLSISGSGCFVCSKELEGTLWQIKKIRLK